jgi:hypothetical protein
MPVLSSLASEEATKGRVLCRPSGLPSKASLIPSHRLVPAVWPLLASIYLEVWVSPLAFFKGCTLALPDLWEGLEARHSCKELVQSGCALAFC